MTNEKNRPNCHYQDCVKLATRALTYFVDAPDDYSLTPKQQVFCDEHAEAEMLELQKPGLFIDTRWDGTKVDCTVNELTNDSLEDEIVGANIHVGEEL